MTYTNKITRPTAVVDLEIARKNLERMQKKPSIKKSSGLILRRISRWRWGSCLLMPVLKRSHVSSVLMAEYFASAGWEDITIAFPVNVREVEAIDSLAGKVKLSLLVESEEVVNILAKQLRRPVDIFIKGDAGYRRTGIDVEDIPAIEKLAEIIERQPCFSFAGCLIHNGQTYHASSEKEILGMHDRSLEKLAKLAAWKKSHYPGAIISLGDTPALSLADHFENVDELRPGNFIFYDVMQHLPGSCRLEDIAISVACPVVAKHPERKEIVVYGGGVHLSKEGVGYKGKTIYGFAGTFTEKGWNLPNKKSYVKKLSQEHGIIHASDELMRKVAVGDLLAVLPVHSCLVPPLLGAYLTTQGEWLEVMRNF
ncbi:MAG: alanine racemase [Bacteroidales bacterium]|nr:alanine racemase [Bacteroidales bacterium]